MMELCLQRLSSKPVWVSYFTWFCLCLEPHSIAPLVGRVQGWNAHRTNWNCCDNNKNSTLGPLFCWMLLLQWLLLVACCCCQWHCCFFFFAVRLTDWQLDVAKMLTDQAICSCKFISISPSRARFHVRCLGMLLVFHLPRKTFPQLVVVLLPLFAGSLAHRLSCLAATCRC